MTANGTQQATEKPAFTATPEQQMEVLGNIFKALNSLNISGEQAEKLTGIKQGIIFVTKSIGEALNKSTAKTE